MELLILATGFAAILIFREIQHDRQVQTLLDRIQAPEKVIAERAPEPSETPLFVNPEDDEAWERYTAQRAEGLVS